MSKIKIFFVGLLLTLSSFGGPVAAQVPATRMVGAGELVGKIEHGALNATASNTARYVAFERNGRIYVADRDADGDGTLDESGANGSTSETEICNTEELSADFDPSISGDGRYAAFARLHHGAALGTNQVDIYIYDRENDSVSLLTTDSHAPNGATWAECHLPSISLDGNFIAYQVDRRSSGSFLTGGWKIFIKGRTSTCFPSEVAPTSDDVLFGDTHFSPAVSGDGSFVAFHSLWSFVSEDGNNDSDVYVWDGTDSSLVSLSTGGSEASNGFSSDATISSDGRYVAFASSGTNLIGSGGTQSGRTHVYLRDRTSGTTVLLSKSSSGAEANDSSGFPSISTNGRWIAFESRATNLPSSGSGESGDWTIYMRDRALGTIKRVSFDTSGGPGNGNSNNAAIAGNGAWIVFDSTSTDLIASDPSSTIRDVYATSRILIP